MFTPQELAEFQAARRQAVALAKTLGCSPKPLEIARAMNRLKRDLRKHGVCKR